MSEEAAVAVDVTSSTETTESSTNTAPIAESSTESSTTEPAWQSPITLTQDGKLLIDGEEADFSYQDIKSIKELRREGHKRLEEAKKLLETNKAEPFDKDAFRKQIVQEHEANLLRQWEERKKLDSMNEYERAIYERDQKIAEYERAKAEAEARQMQETQQAEDVKLAQQLESEYIKAMDEGEVPKTYGFLDRMSRIHKAALVNNFDAPRNIIAQQAMDEFGDEVRETVTMLKDKPTKLLRILGEETVREISKAYLATLKEKGAPSVNKPVEAPKTEETAKDEDPYEHMMGGGWGWMP